MCASARHATNPEVALRKKFGLRVASSEAADQNSIHDERTAELHHG